MKTNIYITLVLFISLSFPNIFASELLQSLGQMQEARVFCQAACQSHKLHTSKVEGVLFEGKFIVEDNSFQETLKLCKKFLAAEAIPFSGTIKTNVTRSKNQVEIISIEDYRNELLGIQASSRLGDDDHGILDYSDSFLFRGGKAAWFDYADGYDRSEREIFLVQKNEIEMLKKAVIAEKINAKKENARIRAIYAPSFLKNLAIFTLYTVTIVGGTSMYHKNASAKRLLDQIGSSMYTASGHSLRAISYMGRFFANRISGISLPSRFW